MHFIVTILLVAFSIPSDETKVEQVICDRYFFAGGNQIFCVGEREEQKPLVQLFDVRENSFAEVKSFIGSHADIEEVTTDAKNVYCMYHNGVVERRRLDALGVVASSLVLESNHESVEGMLYPDYESEGTLIICSSRDFNGPGSDFRTFFSRANFRERKASLDWEIDGDGLHYSMRFDGEGDLYLINEQLGERTLQKHDSATGRVVAQFDCKGKWPRFLRDGTLVLSSGDHYEFWDFDTRTLKNSVVIPNSSFHSNLITIASGGSLEFVDLSGKPIPKYPRIQTKAKERVFSIADEKVILRDPSSGVFRIVDMVSNQQIMDKKKAHNVRVLAEGRVLIVETVDPNGNPVEPPGGCSPEPNPEYRLSILPMKIPALEAKEDQGSE